MDMLRQSFAPISAHAWEEINEEATDILKSVLSARKFVDVEGPKGIDTASVSLGRLDIPANQDKKAVQYGIHQVMPLVEARIPFELDIWELDNIERGSEDINLDNLHEAAKKIAIFEETAIYNGFAAANIEGLYKASEHKPIKLNADAENIAECINKGIIMFNDEGIEGPFNIVAGSELYQKINSRSKGYPLRKHLKDIIGGNIILSKNIKGGLIVAAGSGNFRLTLGQDFSIGYDSHNSTTVKLYLTESFTFQVIDPAAVIVLQ
ncbi:MAG TPA: family 1 encapsulin nanocompartment shell protein [Bacteroidales bacterium]|jgi:uncharacterized linocin/CFP29 family protein|nr:family 1 encapsulin nanocompartment shell protein [Bacteroidales bacterium]MDY0160799.1 family 1 encapsulin nanocompartment shell protein [Bacteroidales bacterium]HXK82548.1 family 1 encapsulin nanocompartment shell protein [Bacteroidales bacterium]